MPSERVVHHVVPASELDAAVERQIAAFLAGGPVAQAATKRLLEELGTPNEAVRNQTARLIAELRASAEGQEGLGAFLEKRRPSWRD